MNFNYFTIVLEFKRHLYLNYDLLLGTLCRCGQSVLVAHKICIILYRFYKGQRGLPEEMKFHIQRLQGRQDHEYAVRFQTFREMSLVSTCG